MCLLASFCFLDLVGGSVIGGVELWVGDHRMGSDELLPGVIGNSNLFAAVTVWENVG